MGLENIRNFCVIAHIDHGKSTLADRFLELTGTIEKRKMQDQVLDSMELERERGITIKMKPVRMIYKGNHAENLSSKSKILNKSQYSNPNFPKSLEIRVSSLGFAGSEFILNLIDTPGHIDFSYEVSRALKAVEGAILLVDATQGVQAQTLSVLQMAREQGLAIIPAVNKIDSPLARVVDVKADMAKLLHVAEGEIMEVSGRTGQGVPELLEEIKVFNIKDKLFVSIAAGITTSFIEKKLGKDVRVIRTMPNLPAQVKQGITAICGGKNSKKKDISLVADIFKEIGKTVIVEEKMIDAVTAVSGSGPAYVFLFVECFVKAAQSLGFDAATSKELVLQTLKGSLCLLDNCNEDAGVLRSRVTSKGGTTQAALEVFAKGKFEKTFKTALLSARKRAKELSRR